MEHSIASAPQKHRKKAGLLANALKTTNQFLAFNGTRRLDLAQGALLGYTPMSLAARAKYVDGHPLKFSHYLPVKRAPKVRAGPKVEAHLQEVGGTSTAHLQEVDDTDGASDEEGDGLNTAESCAQAMGTSASAHENWLKDAEVALKEPFAAEKDAIAETCMAATTVAIAKLTAKLDYDMTTRDY